MMQSLTYTFTPLFLKMNNKTKKKRKFIKYKKKKNGKTIHILSVITGRKRKEA